jgi:uncharacterized membrane protein
MRVERRDTPVLPVVLALAALTALSSGATAAEPPFKEVSRILRFNCTACHNSVETQGGLDLSPAVAHDNLVDRDATGAHAKLVVPGRPEKSYLLAKVLGTHLAAGGKGSIMPLNGKLHDEDIEVIRQWIQSGAKR